MHIYTLVVIPNAVAQEAALDYIETRMEPYVEELDCGCGHDPACMKCEGCGAVSNPEGKWDWYRVGGRWDGVIKQLPPLPGDGFNYGKAYESLDRNLISASDIQDWDTFLLPAALVTPRGEWLEQGIDERREHWRNKVLPVLKKYTDHYFVGLDCHT